MMYSVEEMSSRGKDGAVSIRAVAGGLTKREAADLAIARREPKSAIVKVGHTYRYWMRTR